MPNVQSGVDLTDLNPSFGTPLNSLIADVESQGGHVVVDSGYRSYAKQQALYNSGNGGVPVAKPGQSLHEKGLAADVSGDATTMRLLHLNAAKYGLTFPMSNDPVHIQPMDLSKVTAANPPDSTTPALTTLPARINVIAQMLGTPAPTTQTDTSNVDQASTANVGLATTATTPEPGPTQPTQATTPSAGGDIDKFLSAISGQESGGNYSSTNKDSGAFGKYQIMPSNWSSWAKEAGLGENAAETPQNQDAVARFKIQQYYNQYGNWSDVAKAWYGGPGAVSGSNGGASQGNYPSIDQYANQVMNRMGAQ